MTVQGMLSKRPPAGLGLVHDKLRVCPPGSRNCVCSEATEAERPIAPFELQIPSERALEAFARLLEKTPRAKLIERKPNYLHAEFTSRIFRFVDDVEFRLDAEARRVQVRSASRVGKGDLGANRKRVEELRSQLRAEGIIR
jgi:uncharacterized protein (DUF1499 family)